MDFSLLVTSIVLLGITSGASAVHAGSYADEVYKDAPVAWWRFRDGAATTGAAAKDETGAHQGEYHGGVATDAGPQGIGGKSIRFDGRNGYVNVPDSQDFALQTLSVEFWVKTTKDWNGTGWPASATLISRATEGDGSADWTLLGGAGDGGAPGAVIARVGAQGRSDTGLSSPAHLNDGQWHYVVWTRTATGENRLYVDGGLVATAQDGGGSIASPRPLQIGGDPWLGGKFLDGSLAEVAIYNKVLDETRIAAHAEAAGLKVHHWSGPAPPAETAGGWTKYADNPVLGGSLGTCFDISVLKEGNLYRMWFSWRPKASIALTESRDGIHWSDPVIVLAPNKATGWEDDINRPTVIKVGVTYHLWYTGQAGGRSWIGYATSPDGKTWKRMSDKPAISSDPPWEKVAVMSPNVLWDERLKQFRMWYSAGEQYEPNAVGYATSPDGLHWNKRPDNPIFRADTHNDWEKDRVAAVQVIPDGDEYILFYIGYRDINHAQIGLARSRDGIMGWERLPENPIIRPAEGKWDADACYKPYAIFDGQKWLLWYNGRHGASEQIGLAVHEGKDLGFGPTRTAIPRVNDNVSSGTAPLPPPIRVVLNDEAMRRDVDNFNRHDHPPSGEAISNEDAAGWMSQNMPLLDCPDRELEQIYNFRWWTYRKHIEATPDGFVITEFLPQVDWAGKYNTISAAAGHHFYEGRWIRNPQYLDDYSLFWFQKGGEPRRYSFWVADAVYNRYLVTGDKKLTVSLLDDLVSNYEAWETDHKDPRGLFWQTDDRDGMEDSIGGSGYRPTINSYQYGDASAISKIAALAGRHDVAERFAMRATAIRLLVQENLWDPAAQFYKTLPRGPNAHLVDVRELQGYTPWYFNLPDRAQASAWKSLMDPQGFYAPFGPTTAERRHPRFMFQDPHECLWNGPSWPFATSITLTAMANLLNDTTQHVVSGRDYFKLLEIYTHAQHLKAADGTVVPWIDEDLNPDTGDWIARSILLTRGTKDRGKDYNHSTYCDLVISGLVGLRPRPDNTLEVNPLLPAGVWDYFCLDGVYYHGHWITVLWDKNGEHYHRGKGFRLFVDGKECAASPMLERLTVALPGA